VAPACLTLIQGNGVLRTNQRQVSFTSYAKASLYPSQIRGADKPDSGVAERLKHRGHREHRGTQALEESSLGFGGGLTGPFPSNSCSPCRPPAGIEHSGFFIPHFA